MACACTAETNAAPFEHASTEFDGSASFVVDPEGRRWEYLGTIDRSGQQAVEKTWLPPLETLSDRQLAEVYRPHTVFAGRFEYRLADEHLDELGYQLRHQQWPASTTGAAPDPSLPGAPPVAAGDFADPGKLSVDKHVFSEDTRFNYAFVSHLYPYVAIGKLGGDSIIFPNQPVAWPGASNCSVFKVHNHQTAVTAAHCFKNEGRWEKFPFFNFGFRVSSPAPVQAFSGHCYAVSLPAGYTNHWDVKLDFAVMALSRGDGSGWCPLETRNVGYLGLRHTFADYQHIFGYPAERLPPGLPWGDPVFGTGNAHGADDNRRIETDDIDMTGGQSGGPWIFTERQSNGEHWWFVTGVATREYWEPFDYENQGPAVWSTFRTFVANNGGN